MKAKEVHSILRPRLTTCYRAHGFEPVNQRKMAWYRSGSDRFIILKVHLDAKFGYVAPIGGRIFLRGWCSEYLLDSPPDLQDQPMGPRDLLSDHLLRPMKELGDVVTRKILSQDWSSVMRVLDPEGRATLARWRADEEQILRTPYVVGMYQDPMIYLDAGDVKKWADFLVEAIPCAATELARRDKLGMTR